MKKSLALLLSLAFAMPSSALEVTVYNSNLGLIKETRPFKLKNGINSVQVVDVAAQIDPTSVHFKSLTAPDAVSVLEQDFRYDLISQEKILQRYVGKEIELQRYGRDGDKKELIKGTLLSSAGGRVMKVGDKLVLNPQGEAILPELPEGLLTKPTLMWLLSSRKSGEHEGEISYLTGGLSWNADYVLVIDKDDAKADLNAWVTVANNSGATYKDAKLKLVAGDVHRAPVLFRPGAMRGYAAKSMAMSDEAGMSEKSFFEYHMYSLGRLTTLADNSSKQVEMASAAGVPVRKLFTYDGVQGIQWSQFGDSGYWDPNYGLSSGKKISVLFEFDNKKASGLGIPLPKGRVRVYKKDDDGSLQLAGEDSIDHTPKDEKVRIKMGESFDLVGERKRINYASDHKGRRFEETFEIRLRNHKDADVSVTVVEHLFRWTNWKVKDASAKWTKKDAQTIEFPVTVKKDGETVVTYTVKYSW
ncbi:MAG: hypothetical protein COV48_12740 [Elusimicrobia bacterium CG11_big_fil_rev_8_21_14_0_20_64_6]|nr:MAG: hypothetical protein COV48_12740 [Elusimicrobia bacterium CG11_big_fil_rev_8_21_14_0_20_64_6]